MNRAWIRQLSLRKWVLAGFSAALAAAAGNTACAAGQDTASQGAPAAARATHSCGCLYSVINLGPDNTTPVLNEKGQVALQNFVYFTKRFFDGDRLHDLGALNSYGYTVIRGMNNLGVVVGESDDDSHPFSPPRGFSWTLAGGMRELAGADYASAFAINDRNQSVGYMGAPGVSARAVRWDPNGRVLGLGPLPFSLSQAYAINNHGLVAGFTDTPDQIHATVWDPAGKQIDLGSLGGQRAFSLFVNQRGDVAGYADKATNDGEQGFFWSARDGMVPTGATTSNGPPVNALNDKGEVVGGIDVPGGSAAYLWSRARGLKLLPRGGAALSIVSGVNNKTQMVGLLQDADGSQRAVRWNGLSNPVDLNTLLYRPPAGLKLQGAVAINDAGVIVAASNAGLVMLRPGSHGTDAPVLGPIMGLPSSVEVGQDLRLTLGFVDNAPKQTHTAAVSWTDGCISPHPLVRESGGVGEVLLQHHFCKAGYYTVTVRVTDSGGRVTEALRDVIVNAPGVATIGGTGTLARAAGSAAAKTPPLHFALWAPVATAPAGSVSGQAFVSLGGPFQFRSDQIGPSVRNGQQVRLEGTGHLNGHPGYRFLVEATDSGERRAGSGGSMRVRVTHVDAAGSQVVDFDNGAPAKMAASSTMAPPDQTRVVHGSVMLHD